ncbi:MAG: RNA polymerase sigma factor [Patescibacteria group bacterium]|jgi:RNA polymerase sigma-70 factor (ECF subfamily)
MDPIKAAALAREFEGGSKEAFGELYEAYLKPIYNFVYYKTHHKETAEELTAEVFLKAYRSVNSYHSEKGTFQAWIYQIARHAIIDHYRSNKTILNIDDVWDLGSKEDVAKDIENKIMLEKVQKYIQELPSEQRDIIILRVWQDLSYTEIAEIIGKSEASCKMTFSRALKKLRTSMPEAAFALVLALIIRN